MATAKIYPAKNNGLAPRFSRIKILPDVAEDRPTETEDGNFQSKGGIFIPKTAEKSMLAMRAEKQLTGIVVAVGENVESIMVGERVVFGEFAGTLRFEDSSGNICETGGSGYRYMNEGDVYASFVQEEE